MHSRDEHLLRNIILEPPNSTVFTFQNFKDWIAIKTSEKKMDSNSQEKLNFGKSESHYNNERLVVCYSLYSTAGSNYSTN